MDFLVDVNIAVYNHVPFLRQTLDSVLMQQTTFPFRLIIGDDCSTDGSINILQEYKNKFPDKIMLVLQEKNLGLQALERNGVILLKKSTAKYIALLDGDDYWTDTAKLQKQVEVLEQHSDYAICFHNLNVQMGSSTDGVLSNGPEQKEISDLNDLLKGSNYIGTASCMFRRKDLSIPTHFHLLPFGDYYIHLLCSRYGKIKYINEVMGTYRVHSSGTHGNMFNDNVGKAKAYQQHYVFWSNLKKYESFDVTAVNRNIIESCAWVIQKALETKNFSLFNDYNVKYIQAGGSLFNFFKNYVRFVVYFFRNNCHT